MDGRFRWWECGALVLRSMSQIETVEKGVEGVVEEDLTAESLKRLEGGEAQVP